MSHDLYGNCVYPSMCVQIVSYSPYVHAYAGKCLNLCLISCFQPNIQYSEISNTNFHYFEFFFLLFILSAFICKCFQEGTTMKFPNFILHLTYHNLLLTSHTIHYESYARRQRFCANSTLFNGRKCIKFS